ncbi:MAG TPA: hypothetical protein ENJ84_04705 [Gammaproteobacteria bacterium]|nr:hypothetical protein [Gammaproteobacteria bacterium]
MPVFNPFQKSAVAIAIATSLALTACGGNGNSDDPDDPDDPADPTATNRTVSGIAAKGIIQKGLVTAVELNVDGTDAKTVGTTTTDNEGKYQLKLNSNYLGGPIKVTVSSQPGTTMICDVHSAACDYGKPFTPSTGFSLDAVLPPVAKSATINAQVTPLTHMAASRAIASGKVTKDSVNDANSEVSQLVGVNILAVPPADITKGKAGASDNELTYAAFVAGAGKLALEDAGGLNGGLEKLAATFEDGKFDSSDGIKIQALLDAAESEAANSKIKTTRLTAQVNTVESQLGTDGSYDPKPNKNTGSDVDTAKQLVGQARLWVDSLIQLEQPLQAFGGDVELASEAFDSNASVLVEFFTDVTTQISSYFDGMSSQKILANNGKHQIEITSATQQLLGSIEATAIDNNGLAVTLPATTFSNGVTLAMTVTTTVPVGAADNTPFNLSALDLHIVASVENAKAKLEVNPLAFRSTLNASVTIDPSSDAYPEPDIANADLQGKIILSNKDSGITFTGDSQIKVVKLNNAQQDGVPVSVEYAKLDGNIEASDGRHLQGMVEINIDNAATFDTFAFLNHEAEIYANSFEPGDIFGVVEIAAARQFPNLTSASWDRFSNQLFLSNEQGTTFLPADSALIALAEAEIKKQFPGALSVQVDYFGYFNEGTSYNAQVIFGDFETAQNFVKAEVTAVVDLSLTELPDSHAVLTAKRVGLETGEATFTFTHDNRSLSATINNLSSDRALGTVIFSNPAGAALTIKLVEDQLSGKLEVNGNPVGQIEQTDNGLAIIRYADGTLESLQ